MDTIIISNKNILSKYLWFRGIIIFVSILIGITSLLYKNTSENINYMFYLQGLALISLLLIFLFEKIESPYFLQISKKANIKGFTITTFYPNFKKNIFFIDKNSKKLIVEENDKIQIINSLSTFNMIENISFLIENKNQLTIKSKNFNVKWLNKKDITKVEKLINNHNKNIF